MINDYDQRSQNPQRFAGRNSRRPINSTVANSLIGEAIARIEDEAEAETGGDAAIPQGTSTIHKMPMASRTPVRIWPRTPGTTTCRSIPPAYDCAARPACVGLTHTRRCRADWTDCRKGEQGKQIGRSPTPNTITAIHYPGQRRDHLRLETGRLAGWGWPPAHHLLPDEHSPVELLPAQRGRRGRRGCA